MDTHRITTPEELRQGVVKFLEGNPAPEDIKKTYDGARTCVMRFCGCYSSLPALPPCKEDALDGLHDIMAWCTAADKAVDDILLAVEPRTLDKTVRQLKKLRGLAAKVRSLVNKGVQNETKAQYARKIEEKETGIKEEINRRLLAAEAKGVVGSPLVVAAEIRADVYKDIGFISRGESEESKAVQNYVAKDPTFVDRLFQLQKKEINRVFEKINKAGGGQTRVGGLLDVYCRLKDIPLQQQYDELSHAFTDIADIILHDCKRICAGVDNVIKTFENIRTKAQTKRREVKSISNEGEGTIEPKPPSMLQEIEWLQRYGVKYWKLVAVVICIVVLPMLPKIISWLRG